MFTNKKYTDYFCVQQQIRNINKTLKNKTLTVNECLNMLPPNILIDIHNSKLHKLYFWHERKTQVMKDIKHIPELKNLCVIHITRDLNFRSNPNVHKDTPVAILEIK